MASIVGVLRDESTGGQLGATVEIDSSGVWVRLNGYGQVNATEGDGWVVRVELWNGRPQVVVWPDINSETPVITDLSAAAESLRR